MIKTFIALMIILSVNMSASEYYLYVVHHKDEGRPRMSFSETNSLDECLKMAGSFKIGPNSHVESYIAVFCSKVVRRAKAIL